MKKIKILSILAMFGAVSVTLVGCDNQDPTSQSSSSSDSTTNDTTSITDSSSTNSDTTTSVNEQLIVNINWEMNETYSTFVTRKNDADGLVANSNSFISKEGKFRVGTVNAINIMPKVYAVDMFDPNLITFEVEQLDKNDVEINLYDSTTSEVLNYSDYFLDSDFDLLRSNGTLKFKDNIDESKPRDIKLEFIYLGSDDKDSFPNLSYEISIVDEGYNITNAKQLVLIDNAKKNSGSEAKIYKGYEELKKEVLNVDDLSNVRTSYENFIIINDLVINKEDLPSTVMWSEEINENITPDNPLYGTLIDSIGIYDHQSNSTNEGSESFNLYGNYNRISLGENFPWIRSEDSYTSSEPSVILSNENGTASVDSHTALFSNYAYNLDNVIYELNFYDLAVTGNQGVGESQLIDLNEVPTEDKSDDAVCGGPLFTKVGCVLNYNNVNINNFFTINVSNGAYSKNTLVNRQGNRPTLNVIDSRLSDCFSTMLFNYSETVINVETSVLENSGGFLFINQAIALDSKKWTDYALTDEEKALIKGSDVIVDNESILNNYVTGEGGWFDVYQASSAVAAIKSMVEPALNKIDKAMFNSNEKMNCIVLTMNSDMEKAGALSGNMNAHVKIGDVTYLDYQDGKEEMDQAMSNFNPADQSSLAALLNAAISYDYGASFFAKYPTVLLSNGKSVDNKVYYNTLYSTDMTNFSAITLESLVKYAFGMGQIEATSKDNLLNKYLSLFYYFNATAGFPSDPSKIISDYNSFNGSNAYNLVIELLDA